MSICSLLAGIGVATLSPKIKNTKFLADMFKDYNSFHNHEIFIPVHLGFEKNISILHANELVLMLQWSQKSLFFQHYHNLTAHKCQLLCLPVHKQILSSIFSISPHVPCLNSAAFMFAWRTFERGVRLKGVRGHSLKSWYICACPPTLLQPATLEYSPAVSWVSLPDEQRTREGYRICILHTCEFSFKSNINSRKKGM